MHSPREVHQEAVYMILRYLKSTPKMEFSFYKKNEELSLKAYIDTN